MEDGDPLDVMVVHDVATYPGVVLTCRPLAIVDVEQNAKHGGGRQRNDRVIAVPLDAPRSAEMRDLSDLPERMPQEIARFFEAAVSFTEKEVEILGWRRADAAWAAIDLAERLAAG